MRLNIKENMVFPFSDPSWIVKTLIGLACQILFLPLPILVGYQLRIIRETANGEDDKLPEFDNPGKLWIQGFIFYFMFGVIMLVPMMLGGALVAGAVAMMGDQAGGMGVGVLVLFILAFLGLIFTMCFLMPALMLRYAMTETVSSLFDFSTAWGDIKQGTTDYIAIAAFPVLAGFALNLLAATGIGALAAIPGYTLMMYVQGRMIGNYYRLYFQ